MSNVFLENRVQHLEKEVKRLNSLITSLMDDKQENSQTFRQNKKLKMSEEKTTKKKNNLVLNERKLTEGLKKQIDKWIKERKEGDLIYPSDLMLKFNISYEDSVNILEILEEANIVHKQ